MLKWAIKLNEFNIKYRPRNEIKGQVLADFILEKSKVHPHRVGDERWILETDESSRVQGGGSDMVLKDTRRFYYHISGQTRLRSL